MVLTIDLPVKENKPFVMDTLWNNHKMRRKTEEKGGRKIGGKIGEKEGGRGRMKERMRNIKLLISSYSFCFPSPNPTVSFTFSLTFSFLAKEEKRTIKFNPLAADQTSKY